MSRPKKPSIKQKNGKYLVRFTYTDGSKNRRDIRKTFSSKSAAQQYLREVQREMEDGDFLADSPLESFQQLADWYETTHAIEPVYKEGHKVAGLRGRRTVLYRLRLLREYFGARNIRTITYGQIEAYKLHRLGQTTPRQTPLKLASVHRELCLLRLLLNLATREGWLKRNPFQGGNSLIVKAHERGRSRVLSLDEESRLLAVCVDERAHLLPIVIAALDTGLRPGELFSLTWIDVNLSLRVISVQAKNTKTLTGRKLPISNRLLRELRALYQGRDADDQLVFGIQRSIAKAWKTACRLAGLTDLRFYDLRHTFDSRLIERGIAPMVVSRLMGHAAPRDGSPMTYHYTHATDSTAGNAIDALEKINSERLRRIRLPQTTATNKRDS